SRTASVARATATTASVESRASRARSILMRSWTVMELYPHAARDRVHNEVHAHAQRLLVERGRVFISTHVLPSVAQVALVRIEHGQPIANEDTEAAGRLPVVFVDLGQPVLEAVHHVVDGVTHGNVHQRPVGENAR